MFKTGSELAENEIRWIFNSLTNDKIAAWTSFKAFADDNSLFYTEHVQEPQQFRPVSLHYPL